MDIEWNKANITKISVAGALLLIAFVLIVRVFLSGSKVEVNEAAAEQRSEEVTQGGSRMTMPEED